MIVAVEVVSADVHLAHAVPDVTLTGPRSGIARCGYPAEYLTILPGTTWDELKQEYRCTHC